MRKSWTAGILTAAIAFGVPASGQTYPAKAKITLPQVEVRSGPSMEFYATSVLRQGDEVTVLRESPKQAGWLEIQPPRGSFSWINSRFIQKCANPTYGIVVSEAPVSIAPGSSLFKQAPNVLQAKLSRGAQVVIVGEPLQSETGVWLPIQPPEGEVRYLPAQAVQPSVSGPGPVPAAAPGQLTSLSNNPAGTSQPGHPNAAGWQPGSASAPGQTTTRYGSTAAPASASTAPQWSVWGSLRKTAITKDGQPVYALVDGRGQLLLYVSTRPGFSLNAYLNRTISLYGTVTYRSDEYMRQYFMTATHYSLLP
jgi:hypothetical protein